MKPLLLLFTLLASPFFAPLAFAGGAGCPSSGYCHLAPWTPSDAAPGVSMGYTVAMEGDVAAVTRISDATVEVFERIGDAWQTTAVLPDPAGASNEFGFDLAISGNVLVVGAPNDDVVAPTAGAAHVYEKIDGLWTLDQTIYPSSADPGGLFGISVDIDGDWMAIGQAGSDKVETFLRTPDDWLPWETIAAATDIEFGWSVALRALSDPPGVQLAIGQPGRSNLGEAAGAFSFHTRLLNGSLASMTYFPPGIEAEDRVGTAIDFDDGVLVVAAPYDDDLGEDRGAAYVYEIEDAMWPTLTYDDKLLACTDGLTTTRLGLRLDVDGGRIVLGNGGGELGQPGAAFVYRPHFLAGWVLEDKLEAESAEPNDRFGSAVALSGNAVLAGAYGSDLAGVGAGVAYYVSLTPDNVAGGQCPCDSLASMETYGTGKPGSAGVPSLSAGRPPVPGDTSLIGVKNLLVGTAPILIWGLTQAAIPLDEGTLLVGDPHFHLLPVVSVLGQVGVGWNVADAPALCGLDVFMQAMVLDPGALGPYHTAQSNGLRMTIGY